jgi:hypothetical protein
MLLILLACREMALNSGDGQDPKVSDGADDSATLGEGNDTGQPAYWRLSASLDVEAGLPHASDSTVTIELLDADTEVLCMEELAVLSSGSKAPPDDAIYAWWVLGLAASEKCDVGVESVLLGIGELNADVEAGIPSIGYDDALASSLNGAYFGPDDATEWAFGVAGLAMSFSGGGGGGDESVDGPPIPDGTWLVKPLYPFPL